ncbi:MAG TPA: DUF4189 domain-containing protein [Pseudolabrys sp.]|nr:DUF4189 domain-containing protein [Pseudolabrys sp.]
MQAAALGGLLALIVSMPAQALTCMQYIEGRCVSYRSDVPDRPSPGGGARSTASYGAIAYDRGSHAWGVSHNWGNRARAELEAMKKCGEHGKDCEVMVWFDRKCGAVTSGNGGTAFWGLGNNEGQARAEATKKCEDGGGSTCVMQAYQCSH